MLTLFTISHLIPVIMFITLLTQQNHLLMVLMALEGVTLSLVLFVPLLLNVSSMSLASTCIIILTMGACEASLGLALLVSAARSSGNDMVKSLSVNKC